MNKTQNNVPKDNAVSGSKAAKASIKSFIVLADRLVKTGGRIALVLPVTALAGEQWSGVRAMLASRYQVEFVVSSHDPKLRSMSYDTGIAEILLIARRLREGESATGRGVFVNLWRAPRTVTDSLAVINSVDATAQGALLRSDGPPVGGVSLMVGGSQWGELVDAPIDGSAWTGGRWKRAVVTQFACALRRGELWSSDGTRVLARIKMSHLADMMSVGPSHRQIRGTLGPFESYHGFDPLSQFPALWSQDQSIHRCLLVEPNAYLSPKLGADYSSAWESSGTLHFTPDVRYNSQRVIAV